eukprot:SAG22_NODE_648_length_8185_cov_242.957828_5_plen_177_part_00
MGNVLSEGGEPEPEAAPPPSLTEQEAARLQATLAGLAAATAGADRRQVPAPLLVDLLVQRSFGALTRPMAAGVVSAAVEFGFVSETLLAGAVARACHAPLHARLQFWLPVFAAGVEPGGANAAAGPSPAPPGHVPLAAVRSFFRGTVQLAAAAVGRLRAATQSLLPLTSSLLTLPI